jgi:phospholipid-translocating ATPase
MFNTLFTSLPVIFIGIFEKDLAASTLLAVPELYTKGQRNGGFNFAIYAGWMFMAASEAMVVWWGMWGLFGLAGGGMGPAGQGMGGGGWTRDNSLFAMGQLCYSAVVILISLKLQGIEMHNKSIMAAVSCTLSVGGWWLWNIILAETYGDNKIYKVRNSFIETFGRNFLWWFTLILIIVSVLAFELTVQVTRNALETAFGFGDADTHIFQALEKDPGVKRRFEEAAADELQQGWNRGGKRSSAEWAREEEEMRRKEEEEARRSLEIKEMLRRRGEGWDEAYGVASTGQSREQHGDDAKEKREKRVRVSVDVVEGMREGMEMRTKGSDRTYREEGVQISKRC